MALERRMVDLEARPVPPIAFFNQLESRVKALEAAMANITERLAHVEMVAAGVLFCTARERS